MTDAQTLSPKPTIDEALEFLGMSNRDKAMEIQALLRISEFDSLPLMFDERLTCVPTSIKYGDQYDEDGEFVKTLLIDPEDEREFWSGHILGSFHLYKSTDGGAFCVTVYRIIHDDIAYHISQPDGTISDGVSIGYEQLYFDRQQLIGYKAEYSAHFSEGQEVKDSPPKKPGVFEQRETAFKYWLVGNSGKSIHDRKDLQSCYQKLGEPTREKVWEGLLQMDNRLFARGDDDFFRHQEIISFKEGTGKGRRIPRR